MKLQGADCLLSRSQLLETKLGEQLMELETSMDQYQTLRDLLKGVDPGQVSAEVLQGLTTAGLTTAAALQAICSGTLRDTMPLLTASPPGLSLGVAAQLHKNFHSDRQAVSTRLKPPTHVLRIQFSLMNMPHVRGTLSTMMKDRGLWGTVRRTSPTEVVCDIVCRPENSDAFDDLVKWLENSGKVAQERAAVGSIPTILLSEPRLDSSGSYNFDTSDATALNMVGTRKVFATSQHVKAQMLQLAASMSPDPTDAASSVSSLHGADRYGPM